MKRTMPWRDDDGDSSSDDESPNSEVDEEATANTKTKGLSKASQVNSAKRKGSAVDFEALRRHGYKGGPSVLKVRGPKEADEKRDWTWSTGKEKREAKEGEESYEERQKTRAAIAEGEQLTRVQTRKDKRELSFSQKEKRKRELGQASRGKNYVEEEKRLLRDNGVYSGFDT